MTERSAESGRPLTGDRRPAGATGGLSIEQIVAIESPREFRLHPRDRAVAYTADVNGARQLLVLPLRGGYPIPVTASEKNVSDPEWSPDGRRLAYLRDKALHVIEADGSRDVVATEHPAGIGAPRWSPDGRQLAFSSNAGERAFAVHTVGVDGQNVRRLTSGEDAVEPAWSPDGSTIAFSREGALVAIDVETGEEQALTEPENNDSSPAWRPDATDDDD